MTYYEYRSVELVKSNPTVSNKTILASNTQLVGKTGLEILDVIVDALSKADVMIILDNHMSKGGQELLRLGILYIMCITCIKSICVYFF